MGRVLVNSSTLTSIADAIRLKAETTETYKPAEMPAAIMTLGSAQDEMEKLKQSLTFDRDDCEYLFAHAKLDDLLNNYGHLITVTQPNNCNYMFYGTTVKEIPFEIDFGKDAENYCNMSHMFGGACIESAPVIKGKVKISDMDYMFNSCGYMRPSLVPH